MLLLSRGVYSDSGSKTLRSDALEKLLFRNRNLAGDLRINCAEKGAHKKVQEIRNIDETKPHQEFRNETTADAVRQEMQYAIWTRQFEISWPCHTFQKPESSSSHELQRARVSHSEGACKGKHSKVFIVEDVSQYEEKSLSFGRSCHGSIVEEVSTIVFRKLCLWNQL